MTAVVSGFQSGRRSPLALERSRGHLRLQVTGSGISSSPSSPRLLFLQSVFHMGSSLLVGKIKSLVSNNPVTRSVLGCNLVGAIVVYLFLYESSGLSLEAVDAVRSPCLHAHSSGLISESRCIRILHVDHGTLANGLQRVTRAAKNSRRRRRRKRATVCRP